MRTEFDSRVLTLLTACWICAATACASASEGPSPCTLVEDDQQWRFEHVYAVRAHDAYDMDETTRLTRVVCFEDAVDQKIFVSEDAFIDFAMQYEGGLATVDVRDNGEIVAAGYAAGDGVSIKSGPFGGFSQMHFEGSNGPQSIVGTVTTDSPLANATQSEVTFSISMQLDQKIDATW